MYDPDGTIGECGFRSVSVCFPRLLPIHNKIIAIVSVQAILRRQPEKAISILHYPVNRVLGETLGDCQMLKKDIISLRQTQRRQPRQCNAMQY